MGGVMRCSEVWVVIASRLEAIATKLEAIRLEAIAIRLE